MNCNTLQGAAHLTPCTSKHPKCPPMTIEDIKAIQAFLDLDNPYNTTIYVCMVIVFYSIAHLGEFTVTAITKFDPTKHITHQTVLFLKDQHELPVIKFTLPSTKCAPDGKDVQCTPQRGCISDPESALRKHFHINPAPPNAHLFAWKHPKNSLCLLSKTQFISQITPIIKQCSLADLKGHSLRIGRTLFYLLKDIPFDIVKVMGRWVGKVFTLYLHHHALVLVLRLTWIEANVDLKDWRWRFLMGVFKKTRVSGASAMTPGNNRLHREFKVKGTKEHLLRCKAMT